MKTVEVSVYEVFDWLRFPLIFGVVWLHSYGKPYDFSALDFHSLSGMDCYNLFRTSISMVLTHVCVPLFFFISGYLFFTKLNKWGWDVYLKKLRRRIKTLLIPYILWNILCLIIQLQSELRHGGCVGVTDWFNQHGILRCFWNSEVWDEYRMNWFGGGRIESSPILIPLWYIRDLMVCCIISPVFYWLFKKTRVVGLLLLLFGYITGLGLGYWGLTCHAYMFFGLGAFCNIQKIDVTKITYKWRSVLYVMSILLWIVTTLFNGHNTLIGDYIYPFWVLIGSIAFFNLAVQLCSRGKLEMPSVLTKSSFFIYVFHTIFIVTFSNTIIGLVFGTSSPGLLAIGFVISPFLTTTICFGVYLLLNRIIPKTTRVLTGDR